MIMGRTTPVLSLSMIVKDEGHTLAACLESVVGLVDEIVIADTGSTDNTVAIARAFGATVIVIPWTGSFADARNACLGHCTGEWVLSLDADERLAPGQEQAVGKCLRQEGAGAFRLLITGNQTLSAGSVRQTSAYPRLFRNDPRIRYEGRVHEQIGPSIVRLHMPIVPTAIRIEHTGYDRTLGEIQKKAERNLALLREEQREHPDDWYVRAQIGTTLTLLDEHDAARSALEAALQGAIPPAGRAVVLNLLAENALRAGVPDDAIRHCRESLRHAGTQIQARWLLTGALMESGKFKMALAPLREIRRMTQGRQGNRDVSYDILPDPGEVHMLMARCHEELGDAGSAADEYLQAIPSPAVRGSALDGLVRLSSGQVTDTGITAQLERYVEQSPGDVRLLAGLARVYRSRGDNASAQHRLEHAMILAPTDPSLFAIGISWHTRDSQLDQALQLLGEAEAASISSSELDRAALELAVRIGDVPRALILVDRILASLPAGTTTIRDRLVAMKEKLLLQHTRRQSTEHPQ